MSSIVTVRGCAQGSQFVFQIPGTAAVVVTADEEASSLDAHVLPDQDAVTVAFQKTYLIDLLDRTLDSHDAFMKDCYGTDYKAHKDRKDVPELFKTRIAVLRAAENWKSELLGDRLKALLAKTYHVQCKKNTL